MEPTGRCDLRSAYQSAVPLSPYLQLPCSRYHIEQLFDVDELRREGAEMHHCVVSCAGHAAGGHHGDDGMSEYLPRSVVVVFTLVSDSKDRHRLIFLDLVQRDISRRTERNQQLA